GVLALRDELTALFLGFNQFKGHKGNDVPNILSAWSGEPCKVDRKGNEHPIPICVPHPYICILGGLVPDNISVLRDSRGSDDGLVDRFLFTWPDEVPIIGWSEQGVSGKTRDDWAKVIDRVGSQCMNV